MTRECERCGAMFQFEKSTAELRLTYCSGLCEGRAMVPISVLLQAQRTDEGIAIARLWRALQEENSALLEEAMG